MLGPEDFGRYSFTLSIIAIATLPVVAGVQPFIIRQISRHKVDTEYSNLFGMLRWSLFLILGLSFVSAVVLMCWLFLQNTNSNISILVLSAILLIPTRGLLVRQNAVINGLQRPVLAQVPESIIIPLLSLTVVMLLLFSGQSIDSQSLIYIYLLCSIFSCLIGFLLMRFAVKAELPVLSKQYHYQTLKWSKMMLPLALITIVATINSEIAILAMGFFGLEESIGYFRVAVQGATLLILGLQSVVMISGPRIAALYREETIEELQSLLKSSVRLGFSLCLPVALILLLFGKPLISFLFGEAYVPAADLLAILCFAQLVNVSLGPVGLVLNMTGNEKYALKAQLLTTCIVLLLLMFLVPDHHGLGATIAVSTGMIIWNFIMVFDVYRLTGLKTWIH